MEATSIPRETSQDRTILRSVRRLDGRVTLGDVTAQTGLAQGEAESSLRRLLESRRGHLEVGEGGTLVYRFDPRMVKRDHEPLWSRMRRQGWAAFQQAFKVWIVLMLVVYLVVFVALLLAALFAGRSRDQGGGGGWGGGRGRGHGYGYGHGHFPSFLWLYLIWSPGWGWGRPYYGHRWERRQGRDVKVPVYKKVFAFVFGPDRPRPTQAQKDRAVVRLIRARKGVLTAAELIQHTGLTLEESEEELARLMAAYGGDVKVAGGGELVYVFPDLMVSAGGRVRERLPDPAWRRLEPSLSLTGNAKRTDVAVAAVNGFNLLAAATAPLFIFPRLGLGGPLAWVFLVWVPLVFSAMFFLIPLLRLWSVRRENRGRARRNRRKALLSPVYGASLVGDGAQPVVASMAALKVQRMLESEKVDLGGVEEGLLTLTAEFDADVSAGDDGEPLYRFHEIREQFLAAEAMRRQLALDTQEVGRVVYSSADTPVEASRRDLESFDRELAEAEGGAGAREALQSPDARSVEAASLGRYVASSDRVAYVDDFELVAFDEELKRREGAR